tara:strand:+ start:906 stop:3044 length:2139 start_codon:yes stop_codon:yes gene_type:complete
MWILISKRLYDANETVSEIRAGESPNKATMYWYHTDTTKTVPATSERPKESDRHLGVETGFEGPIFTKSPGTILAELEAQTGTKLNEETGEVEYSLGLPLDEAIKKINKDFSNLGSYGDMFKDIEKALKQTPDLNELSGEGWVLKINKDGELEGFDDQTGDVFNPETMEILGNIYGGTSSQPIVDEDGDGDGVVVDWWSSDWNTDGPNIILLDDKRYALFRDKDGSFRSAGSEAEFRELITGERWNEEKQEYEYAEDLQGFLPIRETNEIWTTFRDAENLEDSVKIIVDSTKTGGVDTSNLGQNVTTKKNQFNNIAEGADLVDVDGKLYLKYAVPGAGSLYQGSTIFMFYEVKDNDPVKAGIVTSAQDWWVNSYLTDDDLDLMGVMAGNSADLPGNDPLGQPLHPFTSFAENLATEAQIAPWILDPDSVALIAEAALEGREVSVAEWAETNWYNKHTESEREWLREYYRDPLTAKQKANDYKLRIENAMEAVGISGGYDTETNQELGVPSALSSYIANKWVSGSWTESYASEQIGLFADPFKSGVRDSEFTTWIETAGVGGLNRTAEQEDRVRQIYTQWLGPVFGQLSDEEVAEKAGRMRNNPDYEAALIENLKTSRLALFPKYTNTELTYDDIVTPWRGMTERVWGQMADETQGWWQDMVAANDYEAGQTVLREKGLEQNVGQVTVAATQALQEALGAGAGGVEANLGVNQ